MNLYISWYDTYHLALLMKQFWTFAMSDKWPSVVMVFLAISLDELRSKSILTHSTMWHFFQNEWAIGLSCSHIFGVKKALRSAVEGRCTWNHSWTCTHMKCIFAPPWKRDPWKGSYFRGHDEGADDLCLFREKTMPEIAFNHSDFSCNVNKVN